MLPLCPWAEPRAEQAAAVLWLHQPWAVEGEPALAAALGGQVPLALPGQRQHAAVAQAEQDAQALRVGQLKERLKLEPRRQCAAAVPVDLGATTAFYSPWALA